MMAKEDIQYQLLRGLLAEGWADSHLAIPEDAAGKDASKATKWKKFRRTEHAHNPVDDARDNTEALKYFKELGLRI